MKITNCLFTLLILLFTQHISAQQWTDVSSSANINNLALCHTFSENSCVVTGSNGEIHKTTDGGMTYHTFVTQFNFGEWFNDIDFISDDVGYVCGGTAFGNHWNFIAKTTDGGMTWDSLIANQYSGYNFLKVKFLNEDIGFIIGENNLFLKTVDGGETFTELILPIEDNYSTNSLYSLNETTAYVGVTISFNTATIKQHKIYKTEDGGVTWESIYSNVVNDFNVGTSKFINDINFYNDEIGYACGSNGLFLKTVDGGLNWSEQTLANDTTNLFKVEIVDSETLYITCNYAYGGGYRKTFKSANGGNTWGRLEYSFGDISVSGSGYATDADGKLFKTDFLIPNENLIKDNNIKIYPSLIYDKINIEISEGIQGGQLNVINELGMLIKVFELENTPNQEFNLSNLSSGFYFVEILNKKGNVLFNSKVIKQ